MMEPISSEAWENAKAKFANKDDAGEKTSSSNSNNGKFNFSAYLEHYGIKYTIGLKDGKTLYFLDECPFNPDHKGKDAAVWEDENGKLCAHCFHNSCTGKGWKDVRAAISGSDSLSQFGLGKYKNKGEKEEKEPTQADQLIMMCDGLELFHDQNKIGFTFLEREVVPLRARKLSYGYQGSFTKKRASLQTPTRSTRH